MPVRIRPVVLAAALATTVLAGCRGGGDVAQVDPIPVDPPTSAARTTTAVPSATTVAPSPPAGTGGDPAAPPVPDVVGMRLPDAKQRLSAAGFADVEHVDATGEGRRVLDAGNWVVRSQVPAAGTPLTLGAPVTLRGGKPTDGAGPIRVVRGVVPRVLCADLEAAQRALNDAGFRQLRSRDGTGQGRRQLFDRQWVVIGQSVAAGRRVDPLTGIVLTVVKYGEPTGTSGCRS
jgi:PASTA domain